MSSRGKNSYKEPLLSTTTEYELISESIKQNKQTMPDIASDLELHDNLELAYSDNNLHIKHNKKTRPKMDERYIINDHTDTEEPSSSPNHMRQRSSTSGLYSEFRMEDSKNFEIDLEAHLIKNGIDVNQHQQLIQQPEKHHNERAESQNTTVYNKQISHSYSNQQQDNNDDDTLGLL